MSFLKELWAFLKARKKIWLLPMIIVMLLLGGLLILAQGSVIAPFNRAWFMLGILLGKIVSPIVLGVMFFLMITPVALLMRIKGRDVLRLRGMKDVSTYWVERGAAEPSASSFKNQF